MKSAFFRILAVALIAALSGELYARFGSVESNSGSAFQPLVGASLERQRGLELPLGPTRFGSPTWFDDEPGPVFDPNRKVTSFPELDDRASDPAILGITGLNFPRVYNREVVVASYCAEGLNSFYSRLPHRLFVFSPQAGETLPTFRFYQTARYPSGLQTNAFGYRSPELAETRKGVLRVAFLGASTVLGHPRAALTSPDYVVHWLNRWAAERQIGVQFDYVNAAREGVDGAQIVEVLKREVAPLAPDIVIAWGLESYDFGSFMELPPGVTFRNPPSTALEWPLAQHSALVRLMSATLRPGPFQEGIASEPEKPPYALRLPADLRNARPDRSNAPPSIARALGAVDALIRTTREMGALPIIVSSQDAAYHGAQVSADRSTHDPILGPSVGGVYGYLNRSRWPMTYADQRAVIEYQAALFRQIAEANGAPFIDVVTGRFLDTALFLDGVHLTPLGMKLLGWWIFQEAAPAIEAIVQGYSTREKPPNTASLAYLTQPPAALDLESINCDPTGPSDAITGALPLSSLSLAFSEASITPGPIPSIVTAPASAAYAASITVTPESRGQLKGSGWIRLRLRVTEGQVSVGLLDTTAARFLASGTVIAHEKVQQVLLRIDDLTQLGSLMISNGRPAGTDVKSRAELHSVELYRFR